MESRSGARPFARASVGARRAERTTMAFAVGTRRRQAKGVFGELGRSDGRATRARHSCGVLENSGNLAVRRLRRQREVAGAVDRIRDDLGDASVRAPSLVRRHALVDDRREQRMSEADRPVHALDHARGNCGIEYVLGDAQAREELGGRTAYGYGEQQRLSCWRRQLVEACVHQSLQCLWNRKRLGGIDARADCPGELERIKRVPAGRLVHAKERWARERPAEACLEEGMESTESEGADGQSLDAVGLECGLELGGFRLFAGAASEQNVDGLLAHPPQREREYARRRRVEPLDVVDGKHDRRLCSESLQCASDCDAERARIGVTRRVFEQQCHLERTPPRRRQLRQDSLEDLVEQVAEAGVSEPSVELCRPRHEDTHSALTRGLDARQPDGGLSDPGGALEHQCRRSLEGTVEECVDGVKLRVSADRRDLTSPLRIVSEWP